MPKSSKLTRVFSSTGCVKFLPSEKGFLYSINNVSGFYLKTAIRPHLQHRAMTCNNACSTAFPNFGDGDLRVDLSTLTASSTLGFQKDSVYHIPPGGHTLMGEQQKHFTEMEVLYITGDYRILRLST